MPSPVPASRKSDVQSKQPPDAPQQTVQVQEDDWREAAPDNREEVEVLNPVQGIHEAGDSKPVHSPAVSDQVTPEEEAVLNTRIEFKLGSTELTAASVEFIQLQLAPVLKKHPDHILHITGHCCTIGDKAVNEKISIHRAQAIAIILIQQGIPEKNLVLKGMDFQKPIASNSTEAGRQKNRRAEFDLRKE